MGAFILFPAAWAQALPIQIGARAPLGNAVAERMLQRTLQRMKERLGIRSRID